MIENRVSARSVALETTLLLHGVPRSESMELAEELIEIVRSEGADPALIGVLKGKPVAGLTLDELALMLRENDVPKVNTSNLGYALHAGLTAATTVATTMEIASKAKIRFFATGGLGGIHIDYGTHWDVSADLAAFTRFPVAVVTSGAKSVLDVVSTREALETLGIPVVGFETDEFPAFYCRSSGAKVDIALNHTDEIARFAVSEMKRTGRGIVIANPISESAEIPRDRWNAWFDQAVEETASVPGRAKTPAVLGALHRISGGETLRANLQLVRENVRLAARLASIS